MTCPLLELKELRLERNSRTVLDATNLVSSGDRIGLLGEGRQVMAAFYGEATVTSGSFLVCGVELEQARRCNPLVSRVRGPATELPRTHLPCVRG